MPVVSVIMVFHRDTPYLRPAIASVLDQTLSDLELVLVDNGTGLSTESLGELGRDPRLHWVRLDRNQGIPAGHNAGVAAARGEFIALLDYDDVARSDRLERQVACLRGDPGIVLVSSRAHTIDESGHVVGEEFALLEEAEQRTFLSYDMPAPTCSFTGRREVFQACPYRAEFPLAGDFDFVTRAAERGSIRLVPEVLLNYRRYVQQATVQGAASQRLSACMIRVLSARRRLGREENLAGLARELGEWIAQPPHSAVTYAHFARRCLDEGLAALAVYHARKLLSVERLPRSGARALRIVGSALRRAPRESGFLLRLFFTGPLRAHGLRRI